MYRRDPQRREEIETHAAARPGLGLVRSVILAGVVAGGFWFAHSRRGSTALASPNNTRVMANQSLTPRDEHSAKLSALRAVVRQARTDLERVRESLCRDPAILSPAQAYHAQAAMNAAQVAVDVAPTAVDMAATASNAARAAAGLEPVSAGPHRASAEELSAQAAGDAARTTVTTAQAAVEAALSAADPAQALTASRAAASAFAAARTAIDAAQTAVDAAHASQVALGADRQPPAAESVGIGFRS